MLGTAVCSHCEVEFPAQFKVVEKDNTESEKVIVTCYKCYNNIIHTMGVRYILVEDRDVAQG